MTVLLLFVPFLIWVVPFCRRTMRWTKAVKELKLEGIPTAGDTTRVSVIVPVRNGADHIADLVHDLFAQDHPSHLLEVIIVDDRSEDDTVKVIERSVQGRPGLSIIRLQNEQGKKNALMAGARMAQGEILLFTDVDVRSGPQRVSRTAAHMLSSNAELTLLPVLTRGDGGLLAMVQYEEQVALLGATIASCLEGDPLLSNGANLSVRRETFLRLDPYTSNQDHASGDDMFLLEKALSAGIHITCLPDPDVVVSTSAVPTLERFIHQRLRWSTKMHAVGIKGSRDVGRASVLIPVLLWAMILVSGGSHFELALIAIGILLWVIPTLWLVRSTKALFKWPHQDLRTIASLFCYGLYAPLLVLLSIFVRPRWKGRTI